MTQEWYARANVNQEGPTTKVQWIGFPLQLIPASMRPFTVTTESSASVGDGAGLCSTWLTAAVLDAHLHDVAKR